MCAVCLDSPLSGWRIYYICGKLSGKAVYEFFRFKTHCVLNLDSG